MFLCPPCFRSITCTHMCKVQSPRIQESTVQMFQSCSHYELIGKAKCINKQNLGLELLHAKNVKFPIFGWSLLHRFLLTQPTVRLTCQDTCCKATWMCWIVKRYPSTSKNNFSIAEYNDPDFASGRAGVQSGSSSCCHNQNRKGFRDWIRYVVAEPC